MNDLWISARLRVTYLVNMILYNIKQIPLIKHIIRDGWYQSKGLKLFGKIIAAFIELGGVFLGKLIMIFFVVSTMKLVNTSNEAIVFGFMMFTLIGTFLNTNFFNPTKDKYYAIVLMGMDAKRHVLSNYFYFLLKMLVGYVVVMYFGINSLGFSLVDCIATALFCVTTKIILVSLILKFRIKKLMNENKATVYTWLVAGVLAVIAYALPFMGIVIPFSMFYMIMAMLLVLGVFSFIYLISYSEYKQLCKELLNPNNIIFDMSSFTKTTQQDAYQSKMTNNAVVSQKTGMAFLNDCFEQRHLFLIRKPIKMSSFICAGICVAAIAFCVFVPLFNSKINEYLLIGLPMMLYVLLVLNRTSVITYAMFMNCDHAMLTYRFYRQSEVVIESFKQRAMMCIKYNLVPALIFAIGYCGLLFVTSGAAPLEYVCVFFSLLMMSVLFSLHHLALYYLLQPYNESMMSKSSLYVIATTITYFVVYLFIGVKVSILEFSIAIALFTILYGIIVSLLIYRFAPKTFKLRI